MTYNDNECGVDGYQYEDLRTPECPVPQSVVTLSVIVPETPQVSLVLFLSSP